jgi:DNA invertase Pin-like site-specific DNA recombinase
MSPTKILRKHLSRQAIVYLRQSTLRQVVEHTESTTRQYALAQRAQDLGWPKDAVAVIDDDLGQSGTTTDCRPGFKRLTEEVGQGQVGALFALEVSRFARSSADWHRLLDLCGWGDVLIVDEQGVFDPKDPNDRLLLGLKGQMSEAEKYWMRLRMHGAKLSKARRGELRLVPPTGYVWDRAAGRLEFDPDEQVRQAIRFVFERFRTEGSAHGVRMWFIRQGLRFPARRIGDSKAQWVNPHPRTVLDILHNPIYTGAYVYGRRETRRSLVDGNTVRTRVTSLPEDQWRVCLRDHHSAYISWEEYVANRKKLRANRTTRATPGGHRAALNGTALLQGIVLCGKCGARMQVQYVGRNRRVTYLCKSPTQTGTGTGVCWMLPGAVIDKRVSEAFLAAAQPPELEISFAVSQEATRQAGELERQWALRIERANYEARNAERRYKAVDPENRVVARTLEGDWEEKLREVEHVEREYEQARRRKKVVLNEEDQRRILELAGDLPQVWRSTTTTQQQRKNLLRILVHEVTLTPIDVPVRSTRVQVLWESGIVTEYRVERRRNRAGGQAAPEAEKLISRLVKRGQYDDDIAVVLNHKGLKTGTGRSWNIHSVRRVRTRLGVSRPAATTATTKAPNQRADGLYSTRGVAERFKVSTPTVRHWIKAGHLCVADGGGRGRPAWFNLDDDTVARLQARVVASSKNSPGGAS